LSLTVCHDVCLSCPFKLLLLFLFLDGIEPFFGHQFSMWHSYTKLFSSIFDLSTLTPKIYSPNFYGTCVMEARAICAHKDLHSTIVTSIITYHRSWMSMARHTCRNSIKGTSILANEICARRGDLVAYRLVFFVCRAFVYSEHPLLCTCYFLIVGMRQTKKQDL